jgi:tetratricopeptide (TPR) repeat protein
MSNTLSLGRAGIVMLLVSQLSPIARAEDLEELFNRANQAYFQGDFEGAARGYEDLIRSGVDDPDVTYNLGTAHGRLGHYGHAIRYFEHAIRLNAGDTEAEQGLAVAKRVLGRRRAELRGETMLEVRPPFAEALVRPFSEETLGLLALLLDLLFFAVLIGLVFVRRETVRLALGISAPLTGAAMLLCALGFLIKAEALVEGTPAIVLQSDVTLREGPDPRAQARGSVDEGTRVRILDRQADHVRAHVEGGRDGWIVSSAVGEI